MAAGLGIEWENVNIAGAFLLGVVFATVATRRVVRAVITLMSHERKRDETE